MDDVVLWAGAVAACGWLAIWGKHERRMPVHWVFKPLPALILVLAVLHLAPAGEARAVVAVALALSLAGDVVLMLPPRIFALGLAAFLLALVAYAIAFSLGVPFSARHLPLIAVPALPGALSLRALWPHVGRLRPAVAVYVVAMVVLVWRLLARWDHASSASYVLGATGGAAFLLADSLLALRRFAGWRVPYPLELGPYFVAQWCLAAATWT